jgi:hypothetical protein
LLKISALRLPTAVIIAVFTLAACRSERILEPEVELPAESTPTLSQEGAPTVESNFTDPDIKPSDPNTSEWGEDLSQVDSQGAVEVKVTPVNLDDPGNTIDFEISLDTHSVDLSMDLAEIAQLITDTGRSVSAVLWDAPMGGHHVGGILSFPTAVDGGQLLDGANEIQLVFSNLEVPERIFIWQKR